MNHSEIVSFIWAVADLIRDTFKRVKYQDPSTDAPSLAANLRNELHNLT